MRGRRVTSPNRPVFGRPNAPKPARKKLSRGHFKRLVQLIGLIVVVVAVWRYFDIKSISITGQAQLDPAKVKDQAEVVLKSSPWGHNLLTLSSSDLSSQLLAGDYRLGSVSVVRHFPQTLELKLSERRPSLNWQTGGQSFVVDIDGTLIGPVPSGGNGLLTVVDSANLPVRVGDKVVPPHFVQFCSELVAGLPKAGGIAATGLKVPDTTSEVYVATNRGFLIKFDTTREASGELADLTNVMATLTRIKKTPAEYIDLRVENKAYYR